MKRSAIYRKAARLIESGSMDRSCWAVVSAENAGRALWENTPAREAYADQILGGEEDTYALDWGPNGADSREAKRIRVLALCFMAAIAESEGQ